MPNSPILHRYPLLQPDGRMAIFSTTSNIIVGWDLSDTHAANLLDCQHTAVPPGIVADTRAGHLAEHQPTWTEALAIHLYNYRVDKPSRRLIAITPDDQRQTIAYHIHRLTIDELADAAYTYEPDALADLTQTLNANADAILQALGV